MALKDLNDLSTQPVLWGSARDPAAYSKNGSNEVGGITNKGTGGSVGNAVQTTTNLKPLWVADSNFGTGRPAFRVNDTVDGQRMAMGTTLNTGILNRSMCAGSAIDWRVRLSGANVDAFDGAYANTSPSLVYVEWDTTSTRFYKNGVLVDTQAGAATPGTMVQLIALNSSGGTGGGGGGVGAGFGSVLYNESGAATLFNANAGNRPLDGDVSDYAYFSAVLSTGMRQDVEGVLCWAGGIALPSGHPYEFAAPATATHYTLTASAGSLAETGVAASLRAGRRLPSTQGGFAATGQAASLRVARRMPAAAGAVGLSGVAAGFRAGRQLSAAPAGLTLTGAAADLARTRRLAAAAGTVALAGQAAGLRRARKLSAAAGSFLVSGSPAVLTGPDSVPTSTWNTAAKSSKILVSAGDMLAVQNAGGAEPSGAVGDYASIRATAGISSGKRVFAVGVHINPSSAVGVGIANASASLTTYLGLTNNSIAIYSDGVYLNDVKVLAWTGDDITSFNELGGQNIDGRHEGANVLVAVDKTNNRLWIKLQGVDYNDATLDITNWNNSGTANPDANVGGIDISAITGTVYPALTMYRAGENGVLNTRPVHGLSTFSTWDDGVADDVVVFDGDSYAGGGTEQGGVVLTRPWPYPIQTAALIGNAVNTLTTINVGKLNGDTAKFQALNYPTKIKPLAGHASRRKILVTIPSSGDLSAGGGTVAAMLANMQTYVSAAVADGWIVIVGTLPVWVWGGSGTGYVVDTLATYNQFNTGIRALTGIYGYFDVAADPFMGDPAQASLGTYFESYPTDAIPHPNEAGYARIAALAAPLIQAARAAVLVADVGAVQVSGAAATLRRALRLSAQAGAFNQAGPAAALRCGRVLPAGEAAILFAGQTVRVAAGRRLTADAGAGLLTGGAAGLRAARRFAPEAGGFVLTGYPVADWNPIPYEPAPDRTLSIAAENRVLAIAAEDRTLIIGAA